MEQHAIESWWPQVPTTAKEWLRGHLRAESIPDEVNQALREAGAPAESDDGTVSLDEKDWEFIATQSEFVD